ncbi:MAG TPA: hypothetical protein VN668_13430 [Stellaceae bacterium]|nr:hypothetical protein [Stellaceae bacterium]
MREPALDSPKRPPQRALIVFAAIIVAALLAIGVYTWRSLGPVEMDFNGYVALILGALGTIGLGCGLMALVFFSHRHGYDDQVGGGGGTPDGR